MRKFLFVAAALGFAAAAQPASAQMASATARLGAGKSVNVNAVKPDAGGAYIEIALPEGPQKLEGLGEQFMPLKSGGREMTLVTADLNGDGIDEIVVRAQVTSTASAILVYQWNAEQKQYFPVQITDSMDQDKPFLFADTASAVSDEKNGIEVNVTRVDQSGRSAQILERYRWDGDRIRYTEDH
jgi:hypothetical protein